MPIGSRLYNLICNNTSVEIISKATRANNSDEKYNGRKFQTMVTKQQSSLPEE